MREDSVHMPEWGEFLKIIGNTKFTQHDGKPTKSPQYTLEGYQWTLKALMDLWPDLQADGFKTLNLRQLNQDIVEIFFGQVRSIGGDCDHPSYVGFADAYGSRLINSRFKIQNHHLASIFLKMKIMIVTVMTKN